MKAITKTFQIVDKETGQVFDEKIVTQYYWYNAKIVLLNQVDGYQRYVYYPAGTEFDVCAAEVDGFLDEDDQYIAMTEDGEEIFIEATNATLTKITCDQVNSYGSDAFRKYFPATLPIEEHT